MLAAGSSPNWLLRPFIIHLSPACPPYQTVISYFNAFITSPAAATSGQDFISFTCFTPAAFHWPYCSVSHASTPAFPRHLSCYVVISHSVVSNSLQPCGLLPTRLLRPWDSPGKSTGVGCHSLLQGSSQPRIEPRSPALQADSLASEPPGKQDQLVMILS